MGDSSGMLEKMAGTLAEPVTEVSMLTVTAPVVAAAEVAVGLLSPAVLANSLQASAAAD
jgi:hypothetical protein